MSCFAISFFLADPGTGEIRRGKSGLVIAKWLVVFLVHPCNLFPYIGQPLLEGRGKQLNTVFCTIINPCIIQEQSGFLPQAIFS